MCDFLVNEAIFQKLRMSAVPNHSSILQNDNFVGMSDGSNTLGYDQLCRVRRLFPQCLPQQPVRFIVQRRKGIVKDVDTWLFTDGSGNR